MSPQSHLPNPIFEGAMLIVGKVVIYRASWKTNIGSYVSYISAWKSTFAPSYIGCKYVGSMCFSASWTYPQHETGPEGFAQFTLTVPLVAVSRHAAR